MKNIKKIGRKLPKYNYGHNPIADATASSIPGLQLNQSAGVNAMANEPLAAAGNRVNAQSSGGGVGGNIAGSVIGFAGSAINSFAAPSLSGTNATYMAKGPIQYQKTDYVNNKTEYDKLKKENTSNALNTMSTGAKAGAAIGSIIPGVGTLVGGAVGAIGGAITGIFGARKRKRALKKKINTENTNITNKNQFNLADSHSGMIEQDYYSDNEDTQDDNLYNEGKTPMRNGNNANALVGKGETIVDGNTGNMTEVTSGSAIGTDDVPAIIKQEDAVAGNKRNPRTGNTFAEDMKPLTRMESKIKRNSDRNIKSIAASTEKLVRAYTQPLANTIIAEQDAVLNPRSIPMYAKGKSFGSVAGEVGEHAMSALNTVGSLAPSIWNTIQGTQAPDMATANQLYATNKYAQPALNKMAKRKYNVKPELEALTGIERRQRYNSRALGSEGGVNRAMDLAGSLGLARQTSSVYANKQNMDNQYASQEAGMMASLGAQEASQQSSAMQGAYDINARNRATKKAYQQAGLQGFANYAQQQQLDSNRKRMDDARLRVLQNYYNLGTTEANANYILGPLGNQ